MVRPVIFEEDPAGVEELFTSPEALAALETIAKDVEQNVERFTPLSPGVTRGRVSSGGAVISGGKAVAYVGTDSPFWHWFEYGSINFEPSRPFARGFEASGVPFEAS